MKHIVDLVFVFCLLQMTFVVLSVPKQPDKHFFNTLKKSIVYPMSSKEMIDVSASSVFVLYGYSAAVFLLLIVFQKHWITCFAYILPLLSFLWFVEVVHGTNIVDVPAYFVHMLQAIVFGDALYFLICFVSAGKPGYDVALAKLVVLWTRVVCYSAMVILHWSPLNGLYGVVGITIAWINAMGYGTTTSIGMDTQG